MFTSAIPRYVIVTAAGVASVLFAAYCIYFDNKRRSDPDFKRKLREKRALQKQQQKAKKNPATIPNFTDPNDLQAFFLQEVQMGEELLAEGDSESAVDHLANAVTLCGQPQQLLTVLHSSLPPPIFALLEERLPAAAKRMSDALQQSNLGDTKTGMVEDHDLE